MSLLHKPIDRGGILEGERNDRRDDRWDTISSSVTGVVDQTVRMLKYAIFGHKEQVRKIDISSSPFELLPEKFLNRLYMFFQRFPARFPAAYGAWSNSDLLGQLLPTQP